MGNQSTQNFVTESAKNWNRMQIWNISTTWFQDLQCSGNQDSVVFIMETNKSIEWNKFMNIHSIWIHFQQKY